MIPFASIGTGWVTMERHVPALRRHGGVKLVGVVDRNEDRARACGERFGVQWATSLDAPWLGEVAAVTIGTPPDSHHDVAVAALERGKHVLTEKPFAMTPAQGRAMIGAAEAAGKVLAVVHNFQFARSVLAAKKRLADGSAGELRSVFGLQFSSHARRLPTWYKTLPCGLFYDEAPHLFYLLKSFLSDFSLTHAHVSRSLDPGDNTPRHVSTVHDRGAVVGAVEMFFDAALSEWQLVLMGSKETLVCDIFRDVLVCLPADGRHEGRDVLRTTASLVLGHLGGTVTSGVLHTTGRLDYGNDEVVRRFVEAVQTGQEPVAISARDGLQVIEAMQQVLAASPA